MKAVASFRRYVSENSDFQKKRSHLSSSEILRRELKTAGIHNSVITPHALVEMSTYFEKFFPEDNDFENYTNYEIWENMEENSELRKNVAKFAVFLYTLPH